MPNSNTGILGRGYLDLAKIDNATRNLRPSMNPVSLSGPIQVDETPWLILPAIHGRNRISGGKRVLLRDGWQAGLFHDNVTSLRVACFKLLRALNCCVL